MLCGLFCKISWFQKTEVDLDEWLSCAAEVGWLVARNLAHQRAEFCQPNGESPDLVCLAKFGLSSLSLNKSWSCASFIITLMLWKLDGEIWRRATSTMERLAFDQHQFVWRIIMQKGQFLFGGCLDCFFPAVCMCQSERFHGALNWICDNKYPFFWTN